MSEDAISGLKAGCGRRPIVRESIAEQLIGAGMVRPDGDRRHGAESGRIETEEEGAEREDDVMRVLILGDDFANVRARRLGRAPCHEFGERAAQRERDLHALNDERVDGIRSASKNASHCLKYAWSCAQVSELTYNA